MHVRLPYKDIIECAIAIVTTIIDQYTIGARLVHLYEYMTQRRERDVHVRRLV